MGISNTTIKTYTVKKLKELIEKARLEYLQDRATLINSYTKPRPAHKKFSPRLFPPRLFVEVPAEKFEDAFWWEWKLTPDFNQENVDLLDDLAEGIKHLSDRKKVTLTDAELTAITGS
jgi:hypothetical protein